MQSAPEPLTTPLEPWDARFGFFWYNDQEIFHDTQEELNRKAEKLARAGINHVITFSCTHFRWSFRRSWELLTQVLAHVVEACHLHGIRVTEHHSSHLTFNPLDQAGENLLDRVLTVRGSSRASWPHLREDCDANPSINGSPLSSFRQIDGRTGKWARTSCQGWGMCFNNPDYRRAYLAYLETLYATGIDGIMTDDVQYFGEGHACACDHCRRLYRERTSNELPQGGEEWARWYGNYDDPTFLAWLDFRFRSTESFHATVKEHYQGLGLRPLRPNYCSTVLTRNWTAYALETLPHLDWVFQENCFSTIIRYSWPAWAVEAPHRFAVGRRRGIPPMSMFYPDREDSMTFCWALAMSWGHIYLATPEGASLNDQEKRLRDFEREHSVLLFATTKFARLGFLDSPRNRELSGDAPARSLRSLRSWMQACYLANFPFDLFQTEELSSIGRYTVVVLNEITLLSDAELRALAHWIRAGGTLVWTGKTGLRDEHGRPRDPARLAEVLGMASRDAHGAAALLPVPDLTKSTAMPTSFSRISMGSGQLLLVPGDWCLGPELGTLNVDRWQADGVTTPYPSLTEAARTTQREVPAFLADLLPDGPDVAMVGAPEGLLVTAFRSEAAGALVLHLVNACGALDVDSDTQVGHADRIPFPALGPGEATITLRKPDSDANRVVRSCRCFAPDGDPIEMEARNSGRQVGLRVPLASVRTYRLLELKLQ